MTLVNNYKLNSAKTDRIHLPCELTDDLNWTAMEAVWTRGKDIEDISNIEAYLVPHVSRRRPTIGFILKIITNDGQQISARVYVPTAPEIVANILDRFFEAGAPGLDAVYHRWFEEQHRDYHNRCGRSAS